jgi:hypothetical protein
MRAVPATRGRALSASADRALVPFLALAGAVALGALILDRSGIAAFALAGPRTVPSVAGGLLLLAAAGLAWLLAESAASRGESGTPWLAVTAVFAVLALEQATTLHEWVQIWTGEPWGVVFLLVVAIAVVVWTAAAKQLRDRPVVLVLWIAGALVWLVAQLPQALGSVRGQGALAASVELAAAVLFALALFLALPVERRPLAASEPGESLPNRVLAMIAGWDVRRIAVGLGIAIAGFGVLGGVLIVFDLEYLDGPLAAADNPLDWFNLNQELTFPAYFSCLLLLAMAGLAGLAAHLRIGGGPLPWILMALVVGFLAFDEVIDLHGKAQSETDLEAQVLLSPLIVVAAVVGVIIMRRLWSRGLVHDLFIGGGIAWIGAQAIDPLTHPGSPLAWPEEMLEMSGSALFVLALLLLVQRTVAIGGASDQRSDLVTATTSGSAAP